MHNIHYINIYNFRYYVKHIVFIYKHTLINIHILCLNFLKSQEMEPIHDTDFMQNKSLDIPVT